MTDEANYINWRKGKPRTPANPYTDPNSPESIAIREGALDCLKKPEDRGTLSFIGKECRDGGKARKEEQS